MESELSTPARQMVFQRSKWFSVQQVIFNGASVA
jgi:hypothetical protein